MVWARARDTALPFYARHGFSTVGVGYVDLTTGLPHHDVIREITDRQPLHVSVCGHGRAHKP